MVIGICPYPNCQAVFAYPAPLTELNATEPKGMLTRCEGCGNHHYIMLTPALAYDAGRCVKVTTADKIL